MVGWHHRLNGRKFEQTPGDSGGLQIEEPGVLQSMGTEQQQNILVLVFNIISGM